ncbi:MAG TPA: hypothetical protein VLE91_00640 [Candidatus Saccharimonadales bacterium]|nr:hypothetical protein [Candidatus Saccharimonadales bacterium]
MDIPEAPKPTGENLSPTQDQSFTVEPQSLEANFFREKLTQLKRKLNVNAERTIDLITFEREGQVEPFKHSSIGELDQKTKQLTERYQNEKSQLPGEQDPRELIAQSKSVELAVKNHLAAVPEDGYRPPNEHWMLEESLRGVDRELQGHDKKKGLSRLLSLRKRKALKKEKEKIKDDMGGEEGETKRFNYDIRANSTGFESIRRRVVRTELAKSIKDSISATEGFVRELEDSSGLNEEVNQIFIDEIVSPYLAVSVKHGQIDQETAERYMAEAKNILDGKESPSKDAPSQEDIVRAMGGGFHGDIFIQKHQILGHMARFILTPAIKQQFDAYRPPVEDENSRWDSHDYSQKKRFESFLADERITDPFSISGDLNSSGFRYGVHEWEQPYWSALSKSKIAQSIFQQDLIDIDNENRDTIFGGYVGRSDVSAAFFYPEPDPLIFAILSTQTTSGVGDRSRYTTIEALTQTKDWEEIFERVVKKYPQLEEARAVFTNLVDQEADQSKPSPWVALGGKLDNLKIYLLSNRENSRSLQSLAAQSASPEVLLKAANKRGEFSDSDLEFFLHASKAIPDFGAMLKPADYMKTDERDQMMEKLNKARKLVAKIDEARKLPDDYPSKKGLISFFQSESVRKFCLDSQNSEEEINFALAIPIKHPQMLGDPGVFLGLVLSNKNQYLSDEGIEFITEFNTMYHKSDEFYHFATSIMDAEKSGILTRERLREIKDSVDEKDLLFASKYPGLLKTDTGISFVKKIQGTGVFSIDSELDAKTGGVIQNLQREHSYNFSHMANDFAHDEVRRAATALSEDTFALSEKNWQGLLIAYSALEDGDWFAVSELMKTADKLNELFSTSKAKNFCLEQLQNQWISYLQKGEPDQMPMTLRVVSSYIKEHGAGPLSQVESLSILINTVDRTLSSKTTQPKTMATIVNGLSGMETRFTTERWSNEDKTDFYNTSRDIINASPGVFADYLDLFGKFNQFQMRQFSKDLYPLYRAKFTLTEKEDQKGNKVFDTQNLIALRKDIRNFTSTLETDKNPFEKQREKLLGDIKDLFTDRFGIIKIPSEFTNEHIRSFTDISMYLANLADRNPDRETTLGFYLSLKINDKWNNFRQGEEINPEEYLTKEKAETIQDLLEKRKTQNPLTPEALGIPPEDIDKFMQILQQETENITIGNIETIDVKLANIILNLRGLEDLDLYPDPLDKQRMSLLLKYGNKAVGATVAKMYQQLTKKQPQFSEQDEQIRQQVEKVMSDNRLELTPEAIKEHFQDGMRPMGTVFSLLNLVNDANTDEQIESLRSSLKPSDDVIAVFARLGEDFHPASGAMAVSQDLDYLENLVVRKEDQLQTSEKELLTEYISQIREKMVTLEGIYAKVKNSFTNVTKGSASVDNPLLAEKFKEIEGIINSQSSQQAVTSTYTNDLNVIIENIRECLSCKNEGSNNDTNLTLGDSNKFFLYTHSQTQERGSISDELIFIEPITQQDGTKSIAFVLDTIYGIHTPTILGNHVETIVKKYRQIKKQFPDINLKIFVTQAAISTGATSLEYFTDDLKRKDMSVSNETVEVDVAPSAFSDHYIEFGGDSRSDGVRQVNGLLIAA